MNPEINSEAETTLTDKILVISNKIPKLMIDAKMKSRTTYYTRYTSQTTYSNKSSRDEDEYAELLSSVMLINQDGIIEEYPVDVISEDTLTSLVQTTRQHYICDIGDSVLLVVSERSLSKKRVSEILIYNGLEEFELSGISKKLAIELVKKAKTSKFSWDYAQDYYYM